MRTSTSLISEKAARTSSGEEWCSSRERLSGGGCSEVAVSRQSTAEFMCMPAAPVCTTAAAAAAGTPASASSELLSAWLRIICGRCPPPAAP